MALSYTVTTYQYSAKISISGLNTEFADKRFTISLNGSEIQTLEFTWYSSSYDYFYAGLDSGTQYYFYILPNLP